MANELAKKSVRNIFNNIPNLAKESDSKRKIIEACEMASKLLKALRLKKKDAYKNKSRLFKNV